MFGLRMWIQVLLFVSGATPAAAAGLDCTNNFVTRMSCHFESHNCSGYNLTLEDENEEKWCVFQDCDTGLCCCSVHMSFTYEASHRATVWKGNKYVESKDISIKESIKPETPTLVSVNESNGNFQLRWRTNMDVLFCTRPAARVTYYKKGDTKKVSKCSVATTDGGLGFYEIPGRDLEASTTYVVGVRTYTDWSGKYSDGSEEWEFTTASSSPTLHLLTLIALSAAAVLAAAAAAGCFYRVKAKWTDTVAKCPKPKLSDVRRGRGSCNLLKPPAADFSCVSVLHPVGCADVTPVDIEAGVWGAGSQLPEDMARYRCHRCVVGADDVNRPAPTDVDNMTYFTGCPAADPQAEAEGSSFALAPLTPTEKSCPQQHAV